MSNPGVIPARWFAFLSYSHADEKTAARLARYLETFRVPVRLGGPEQRLPARMAPIFRDRDEFSASRDLGAAITEALAQSRYLIVLCSPSAAKSRWVNEEIETFSRLSSPASVFTVLVDGDPSESFPPALVQDGVEPLSVDLRPAAHDGHDARLRLVAALLGIQFDALKRRERTRIRNARLRTTAIATLVAAAFFFGIVQARNASQQRTLADTHAQTAKIREYQAWTIKTRNCVPIDMAVRADGDIWFTDAGLDRYEDQFCNVIGRRGSDGRVTEFSLARRHNGLQGIAAGRDGNLWFTESRANQIGRITSGGTITEFQIPTSDSGPEFIAAGLDGALWFTQSKANKIGRITTAGALTEFSIPTRDSGPNGIAPGPHGDVWFTEIEANKIGRIIPDGTVTEFPIPTSGSRPYRIAAGPDGNLWFTENEANQIGRITPGGRITEFHVPTQNSRPAGIAAGPSNVLPDAMWFTEWGGNKLGRITPDGRILEIPLPHRESRPRSIVGNYNDLWFTDGHQVGLFSPLEAPILIK